MLKGYKIAIVLYVLACALAALFGRTQLARAEGFRDCSAATERGAMAEYDTIAGMLGIPKDSPIFKVQKPEYVAVVCLHEELRR